jgi:MFS family permease
MNETSRPWYSELTRYHWFVLIVAALGWLFDCLDQQLFILTRPAAMRDLLPAMEDPAEFNEQVKVYGNYATSIFLIGWAAGGLFFGVLGDRWGRAKTMMVTILMYSIFTGLSALAQGFWDFAFYRFLTGLGVGGEFAVGVALVAEVMPSAARPYMLGFLQALSAVGNISAAGISYGFGVAEQEGLVTSPWRFMYLVGALPAILALVIRRKLKEPERWQALAEHRKANPQLGSYRELLGDPRWRKNALLGLVLACSGVIGLWGVGFFTPDLMRYVQRKGVAEKVLDEQISTATAAGDTQLVAQLKGILEHELQPNTRLPLPNDLRQTMSEKVEPIINGKLAMWQSLTSVMINCGAFLGMFAFGPLSQRIGRRPTFALAFLSAFLSTAAVFWFLKDFSQLFWMVPIMGFCQLSLFAGYAIYFPELFPTRLRSTGTSFCYNVGRFIAASGPLIQAQLIKMFSGSEGESLRYAGVIMCGIFLLGLAVLPFAPETKGKPLPE